MSDRCKDFNWVFDKNADNAYGWDAAKVAVLMDIRDELKTLNRLLGCPNFIRIPSTFAKISANTRKPTRKRKA